jgi:hypothetical protein
MTFLPTEAFDFSHGQATNANRGQRLAHFVEFEWFDDGGDLLHRNSSRKRNSKKFIR